MEEGLGLNLLPRRHGRRGRPRRGIEVGLTQERLTAALLSQAKTGAENALSMRAVAAALGVSVRLLYTVVKSQDELFDMLSNAVLAQCPLPPEDASWQERIAFVAREGRRVIMEYPSMPLKTLARSLQFDVPAAECMAGETRRAIEASGLEAEPAAEATIAFHAFFMGHLAITEIARRAERSVPSPVAPRLDRDWFDASFERGLALFIAGLERPRCRLRRREPALRMNSGQRSYPRKGRRNMYS